VTFPVFFVLWGVLLINDWRKYRTKIVFLTSMNEKLMLPIWAKLFKMKVIFVEHGTYMEYWKKIHLHIPLKIITKFLDYAICVSDTVAQTFLENGIYVGKTRVISHGINLPKTDKELDKYTRATATKKLGVSEDDFILGYAGRIEENKGTQFIVRALAKLNNKYPNIKIVYIGEGDGLEDLKKESESLGIVRNVLFLGRTTSPPWYLFKAADVWVQPSLYEGISFVALEAAASSKAIIASNVGGLKDIFRHGENGLLFESGNVDQLVEHIETLYNDKKLREKLGKLARETIEDRFSLRTGVKSTLDLMIGT